MGQAETPIQSAIIEWLIWHRFLILRINSGGAKFENKDGSERYVRFSYWAALGTGDADTNSGISDTVCCSPSGRFCAFEVKTPEGEASQAQKDFGAFVTDRGGIFAFVTSTEDVERILVEEGEIEA